jgi:hypothetical protein
MSNWGLIGIYKAVPSKSGDAKKGKLVGFGNYNSKEGLAIFSIYWLLLDHRPSQIYLSAS